MSIRLEVCNLVFQGLDFLVIRLEQQQMIVVVSLIFQQLPFQLSNMSLGLSLHLISHQLLLGHPLLLHLLSLHLLKLLLLLHRQHLLLPHLGFPLFLESSLLVLVRSLLLLQLFVRPEV